MKFRRLSERGPRAHKRRARVLRALMCAMILASHPSPARAQGLTANSGCTTDLGKRFLCPGDRAPEAGHLIPALTYIQCAADRKTALEVPGLELQLNSALSRVTSCAASADGLRAAVADRDGSILDLEKDLAATGARLEAAPTLWTVAWVSAAALALGFVVGAGSGFVLGVTR